MNINVLGAAAGSLTYGSKGKSNQKMGGARLLSKEA
jgi:hypothetical protein